MATFARPALNRLPLDLHSLLRASLAALLGRVMPFWMATSAVLNLPLLLPFEPLTKSSWRLALMAFAIQVVAILCSLVAPVPINNRMANWTPQSDWKAQEGCWEACHWFGTSILIGAFNPCRQSRCALIFVLNPLLPGSSEHDEAIGDSASTRRLRRLTLHRGSAGRRPKAA
jgi:hypothetical protein